MDDVDAPAHPPSGPPTPAAATSASTIGAFDRRSILLGSLALATLAACKRDEPGGSDGGLTVSTSPPTEAPTTARAAFLPVMVAIADRLVPADETGPGAKDVDVAAFFGRVFDDPRLGTLHPLLKRGCAFLMKAARAEGNKAFVDLDVAAQDDLLLRLSENQMRPDGFHGPTFVRVMLALTLEGFLGDPRHGGNKDGVGWRVVGFSPEGRAQGLALAAPSPSSSPSGLKVVP